MGDGDHQFDEETGRPVGEFTVDPVDGNGRGSVEFDFAEVERNLGEPSDSGDLASMALALRELLRFLVHNPKGRTLATQGPVIAVRTIALAWTINPDIFEGGPSLNELARRYKVNPKVLSWHAQKATQLFGIMNRAQRRHGYGGWGRNKARETKNGDPKLN